MNGLSTATPGTFYVIQLEPQDQPGLVKLGWATVVERRLIQHQKERRRPNARVAAQWPCLYGWEQQAIMDITGAYCRHVRGEEYVADDVSALLAKAGIFFSEHDAGNVAFPVTIVRRATTARLPKVVPPAPTRPPYRPERLYLTPEVAATFRVTEETVRRWLRLGRLRGMLPGGDRGGYRIPESEVQRFRDELMRGERPPDQP